MHLADTFIQSDLQAIYFFQYVFSLEIEPTNFCAANTMLYPWATATVFIFKRRPPISMNQLFLNRENTEIEPYPIFFLMMDESFRGSM